MSKNTITFKEFKKIEMKTGKIINVDQVTGSDKLYKIEVDLGEEKRQIVSGLVEYYSIDELMNKTIIVVTNLKPAKIFGETSNGMLLCAEIGEELSLLTIDRAIKNGAKIT